MELRQVFRPGWRVVAASIAVLSGPVSVAQAVFLSYLASQGKNAPATFLGIPLYVAPAAAIISLVALYLGEVSRAAQLEVELGKLPSHRKYTLKTPQEILEALDPKNWRYQKTAPKEFKGRWIRGEAYVVSIRQTVFWMTLVTLADKPGYRGRSWGYCFYPFWQRSRFDYLDIDDCVAYEGKIADTGINDLQLRRLTLTPLAKIPKNDEKTTT